MSRNHEDIRQRLLRSYETTGKETERTGSNLFQRMLGSSLTVFFSMGFILLAVELPPEIINSQHDVRRATFLIKKEEKPQLPEVPKLAEPEPDEVEDLTRNPELDQEVSVPAEPAVEAQPEPEVKDEELNPRPVYGVRKVFAKGLGSSSGSGGMVVVSKRGNTLAIEPDTLTATEIDLKGALVGMSTVSEAPRLVHPVKPAYTKEMIKHRVSGTIKAKLLIDINGTVRRVEVLEDLGYDSKDAATDAFTQLKFDPAKRDGKPVAVWIIFKYPCVFAE